MQRIMIVSDGTGETAAHMTKAALVQFSQSEEVTFTARYKNVRSATQLQAICDEAEQNKDLIVFTLVSQEARETLLKMTKERDIPCVDLLGPLLRGLATHFGYQPKPVPGRLHDINDEYFDRIEAMEYTIAHDDGKELTNLADCDLLILGISRTSKTPLSMYLSHQGWRVANIPIISGFELPKEVFEIDQKKIVGLTIDVDDLTIIRRARLERLGHDRGGEYADPHKVQEEIDYAADLFRRNRRWPVFNVTGKALEETASEIIKLMSTRMQADRMRRRTRSV